MSKPNKLFRDQKKKEIEDNFKKVKLTPGII